MLRALGVDARHVASIEGMDRNAPDIVWIPVVAANAWIAVGGDIRILRNPAERACVWDNGLIYFTFAKGFPALGKWEQAAMLIKAWPEVTKTAERASKRQCFVIGANGKVSPYDVGSK